MRSFFDWFADALSNKERPWLILGKGPSFSKLDSYSVSNYATLALNHVVRERKVDVAHIIDSDVVAHCGESLLDNAKVLVMPWHPHVRNNASPSTLEDMVQGSPILKRLNEEGRLLWYNLSTSKDHRTASPIVSAKYFSAEAGLNLLVAAGVRCVRSLGIDGGASYSSAFADLNEKTLLANSRTTFDDQFREIARTIRTTGVDFAPLDIESPIRVFVATTEAQMLAVKVLDYSIKKHASMSVEVFPMHLSVIKIPTPLDSAKRARTPFSFQRFLIPQLMAWKGRAIYLDSDMQVFSDMRKLWTLPFNGAQLLAAQEPESSGRRPQFSVMLLDCSVLDWRIEDIVRRLDDNSLSYKDLMHDMKVASAIAADIEPKWNSLERYDAEETALLHYTDMNTQPWVSTKNPLGYLWMRDLFEAVDAGVISTAFIERHVDNGWVRPSLLWQLERREESTTELPGRAQGLDKNFVAPYQSLSKKPVAAATGANLSSTFVNRSASRQWGRRFLRSIRAHFSRPES